MADTRVDLDRAATEAVLLKARYGALVDGSTRLNERCQLNSPVGLTGNLRRSHDVIEPDPDAREAGVEATADYAAAVHEGAVPHDIRNAFGRGETVRHPGNKAQPWMTRSVDELAAEEMG